LSRKTSQGSQYSDITDAVCYQDKDLRLVPEATSQSCVASATTELYSCTAGSDSDAGSDLRIRETAQELVRLKNEGAWKWPTRYRKSDNPTDLAILDAYSHSTAFSTAKDMAQEWRKRRVELTRSAVPFSASMVWPQSNRDQMIERGTLPPEPESGNILTGTVESDWTLRDQDARLRSASEHVTHIKLLKMKATRSCIDSINEFGRRGRENSRGFGFL
jgi:hypothetical protein